MQQLVPPRKPRRRPARALPQQRQPGPVVTHDGVRLQLRHWPSSSAKGRPAVILLLGIPEDALKGWPADRLGLSEATVIAVTRRQIDRRTSGIEMHDLVRDLQSTVEHLSATCGVETRELIVVAAGDCAVIAAAWVHDYAPAIRALALLAPPFALKRTRRGAVDEGLAHRLPGYSATAARIVADAAAIQTPTLVVTSGADKIAGASAQGRFFARLGARTKKHCVLDGAPHHALSGSFAGKAEAAVADFLKAQLALPARPVDLTRANTSGYTFEEAARLAKPLFPLSPRALFWAATRLGLRFGARLSDGIAVGQETGFDSGSMLDYVYRNEAQGKGLAGRVLDRIYLDQVGWKGIRQRKIHAEELIGTAMSVVAARGLQVRVIDIAAGHGRYALEALDRAAITPESILLRDYSATNVEAGRALIAEKNLEQIARFVKADAFNADGIAATRPQPTVAIVSGLYELFADNDLVARSLAGLARAVPAGGCLVYTNQPWHPQLELIARALTSHREGQAWVMRRRTQAEMDQLVAAAGFAKVTQRIDRWGIFSVSLAVRVGT